jgi:hypothetical protein
VAIRPTARGARKSRPHVRACVTALHAERSGRDHGALASQFEGYRGQQEDLRRHGRHLADSSGDSARDISWRRHQSESRAGGTAADSRFGRERGQPRRVRGAIGCMSNSIGRRAPLGPKAIPPARRQVQSFSPRPSFRRASAEKLRIRRQIIKDRAARGPQPYTTLLTQGRRAPEHKP